MIRIFNVRAPLLFTIGMILTSCMILLLGGNSDIGFATAFASVASLLLFVFVWSTSLTSRTKDVLDVMDSMDPEERRALLAFLRSVNDAFLRSVKNKGEADG